MYRSDFNIDLQQVASLWSHGSVVRSWLIELAAKAFNEEDNDLEKIAPYVDDSGTARWTTDYAVENAVPVPTITMSLYKRFASRLDEPFSDKVIAALRNQFGGHAMKEELANGK
jgi:6-phosphogluconate dehydrogenase